MDCDEPVHPASRGSPASHPGRGRLGRCGRANGPGACAPGPVRHPPCGAGQMSSVLVDEGVSFLPLIHSKAL
jgi:hypothetical protein